MKAHVTNSVYGVFDYVAYPAGMLVMAPAILHEFGIDRYGVWVSANALLMTGAILACGFGDANIQFIAEGRSSRTTNELVETVRTTLGIHLALGLAICAMVWVAAPVLTRFTLKAHTELSSDCLWAFRITALLILMRALETVCGSTQRAFSCYGAAIQASVAARMLSLAAAWLVPHWRTSVAAVMLAMLAINGIGLVVQFSQLFHLLGIRSLRPTLRSQSARRLLGFGTFTWLQAASGLFLGQVDRLVAGVAVGTSAVTVYTFCTQLAQPVYGITAAGLHFLFPYLASSSTGGTPSTTRRAVLATLAINFAFVAASVSGLVFFGNVLLLHWVGPRIATASGALMPLVAWGSGLSALSVTGAYSLLALGKPRMVASLSVLGGLAMAASLALLVPRWGLMGIAYSRLIPGLLALLVYVPLYLEMRKRGKADEASDPLAVCREA